MTTEITDIESLLNFVISLKKDNTDKELFFRGQKKHYENVTPSICRDGYIKNEDTIFREFITKNPNEFPNTTSTFDKLVKMQHYGLPTRLLDITSNPLVALFFATEEDKELDSEDGQFIAFPIPRHKIKFYDSDTVSVLSNIAKRPADGLDISSIDYDTETKQGIERFNKEKDIKYLLHDIRHEKPHFDALIKKKHLESIFCVKPLLNNRRIINQDGAFLLFGINKSKATIAEYNASDFEPIKITVKNKSAIRESLKALGLTYDKIYPELDTTAKHLKEKYKNQEQISIKPEDDKSIAPFPITVTWA
nr:FRG domain-containing protein [uncultured Tolumonas sp.]